MGVLDQLAAALPSPEIGEELVRGAMFDRFEVGDLPRSAKRVQLVKRPSRLARSRGATSSASPVNRPGRSRVHPGV